MLCDIVTVAKAQPCSSYVKVHTDTSKLSAVLPEAISVVLLCYSVWNIIGVAGSIGSFLRVNW